MRFIVDLFRVLVIGLLALLLIAAAFAGFTVVMGGVAIEPGTVWPLAGAFAGAAFALGLLAVLIAIHDRLADIACRAGGDKAPLDPDHES